MRKPNGFGVWISGAAFWLAATQVQALGLGPIFLKSHLNQPLEASVEMNSIDDVSASEIRVKLADQEAFDKAGIERPFYLTHFEFKVGEQNGKSVIEISSSEPIQDPFLSFVVEANWGSGKVLREYTLLLDPSSNQPKPSAPVSNKAKAKTKQSVQKDKASSSSSLVYGPVRSTDTLWSIAAKFAKDMGADHQQMIVAITKKNPHAFNNGNIHSLLEGAYLKIPVEQEMAQLTVSEAIAQVSEQAHALKNQEKTPKLKSVPVQASFEAPEDKPLTLIMPESASLKPSQGQDPVVKTAKAGQPTSEQMQNRLLLIEETLDTLKHTNQSLQEQQRALEEQNQTLVNMIRVKDEEILLLKQSNGNALNTEMPSVFDQHLQEDEIPESEPAIKTNLRPTSSLPDAQHAAPAPQVEALPLAPQPVASDVQSTGSGIINWWLPLLVLAGFASAAYELNRRNKWVLINWGFWRKQEYDEPTITVRTQEVSQETSSTQVEDVENAFALFDEEQTISQPRVTPNPEARVEVPQETLSLEACLESEQHEQAESILKKRLKSNDEDWDSHLKLLNLYKNTENFQAFQDHMNLMLPSDLASQAPSVWNLIQEMLDAPVPAKKASSKPVFEETTSEDAFLEVNALPYEQDQTIHHIEYTLQGQATSPQIIQETTVEEKNTSKSSSFSYLKEQDKVETKLALAQAYFDLGDFSGAKDHVQEVLTLGNEAQIVKANALLKKMTDAHT